MTLYKRRMLREWLLLAVVASSGFAVGYICEALESPSIILLILLPVVAAIVLLLVTLIHHRKERFKRSIIEMNGFVCKYCGYDLRTTREFQCPECGREFNPHELPKYWQKVLRLKDRPSAPTPE